MDEKRGDAWVEVVFALRDVQRVVRVAFEPGLTAERAVQRSKLADEFPALRECPLHLGVYGEPVAADRLLSPGERVEICRPLKRDPRDQRRSRAVKSPA
jgi:putative ubiquitin-RnfH superfamily antitoxin RatB of RatAB toxin-antitoxin module